MQADGQQPHVVSINDSPDLQDLFVDLLEEEGYRVTTMASEACDVEAVIALQPHLLILDYLFEDGDGTLPLLEDLRAHPLTAHIPVVICTGAVNHLDSLRERLSGERVTILPKPFNIDQLIHIVASSTTGEETSIPGERIG